MREAAIVIFFITVTVLTVIGHDPTFPVVVPYGKYLLPLVLAVDGLLLIVWRPSSAVFFGVLASVLQSEHGTSTVIVFGTFVLMILAAFRAAGEADRIARRGAWLFPLLAVLTLVPGTIFTGLHDTAGEPLAIVYAAAIGACAAVVRAKISMLLAITIAVGSLASYLTLTTPQLRTDRTFSVLGQNANGLGMLAAMGAVAALIAIKRRSFWLRVVGLAIGWLCVEGIVSSGSRGALLAAIAGAAALLGHRLISGSPTRMTISVAALIAGVYFIATPAFSYLLKAAGRSSVGSQDNVHERTSALTFALRQGLAHPFFGVGLNRLPGVSFEKNPNAGLGLSAHNVFAGVFAECGITAALALIAISVLALLRSRRHASDGLLPLVITVLVNGLTLAWWGTALPGVMAALILGSALGLGAARVRKPQNQSEPADQVATPSDPPPAVPRSLDRRALSRR